MKVFTIDAISVDVLRIVQSMIEGIKIRCIQWTYIILLRAIRSIIIAISFELVKEMQCLIKLESCKGISKNCNRTMDKILVMNVLIIVLAMRLFTLLDHLNFFQVSIIFTVRYP